MSPPEVARLLEELASLLELQGENPFKLRAYEQAVQTLEAYGGALGVDARGRLDPPVPGLSPAMAEKVATLVRTGELPQLREARAALPPGWLELRELAGLGPKKIRQLSAELGVDDIPTLEAAIASGTIAGVSGFADKTVAKLRAELVRYHERRRKLLGFDALMRADARAAQWRRLPGVLAAQAVGEARRGLEIVDAVEVLVVSDAPEAVREEGAQTPALHEPCQVPVRYHHCRSAVAPVARVFHQSAASHWQGLVAVAAARGWRLAPDAWEGPPLGTEADLYAALGLPFHPPELREAAPQAAPFGRLLEPADIRGVFHNHTTASDGAHTLEEMVAEAERFGWEYLGISDHSRSSVQANGLSIDRLRRQGDAIRELNASGRFRCQVLAGSEVDILPDGALDYPDEVLAELDFVVASVHSAFTQSEAQMTARLVAALRNPYVAMLGHCTGRILLRRPGYGVDFATLFAEVGRLGKVIELNTNPVRLDLDWRLWPAARAAGVLCSINPDAHHTSELGLFAVGVTAARKAALGPAAVLNTRPLAEVQAWLTASRAVAKG